MVLGRAPTKANQRGKIPFYQNFVSQSFDEVSTDVEGESEGLVRYEFVCRLGILVASPYPAGRGKKLEGVYQLQHLSWYPLCCR